MSRCAEWIENAGSLKFQAQTRLIDGFEQPRADRPVNLDRQSNDPFRQIAMFKHCLPPWSFVASVVLRAKIAKS
jgi:hypothetical protein